MASDFDKLFGDDWRPQDSEAESGPASLRGRRSEDGELFGPLVPYTGDSAFPEGFTSENENRSPRVLNEKEVKVMGVYSHQEPGTPPQHFVLLRDNRGRKIYIWVGQFEAWAIASAVEGDAPDRPLTHDLIKQLLERLEATVERVIIDDLWGDTFYAKIGLVKPGGETLELDARPSDAIALAVRLRTPIYMAEDVILATVKSE